MKNMSTWNEYKDFVKSTDPEAGALIAEAEAKAAIITAMIEQRDAQGLSQRDLAALCDMPQSTVARIEANKTNPTLDTLLLIMRKLGLTLTVRRLESQRQ